MGSHELDTAERLSHHHITFYSRPVNPKSHEFYSHTQFFGDITFFHLSKYLQVELLNDGIAKYITIRNYHIGDTVLPLTWYEIFTLPVSPADEPHHSV